MSDSSQVITESGIYDAYGNLAQDFPASSSPSFGYAGQERCYVDFTALDYLKARYYQPATGRFISRDPIRHSGGLNLYSYGDGNPVVFVDGSGLKRTYVGCSTNQRNEIDKNLDDIKNNRLPCITGGARFASCVANRLDDIVINCRTNRNPVCSGGTCGFTKMPFPRKTIDLCSD